MTALCSAAFAAGRQPKHTDTQRGIVLGALKCETISLPPPHTHTHTRDSNKGNECEFVPDLTNVPNCQQKFSGSVSASTYVTHFQVVISLAAVLIPIQE